MKSFEYYEDCPVEYRCLSWQRDQYEERVKQIDNTPMTVLARTKAREDLKAKIEAEAKEFNKAFITAANKLRAEFWADIRVDLGYGELFDEEGVKHFEEAVKVLKDDMPKDYSTDYICGDMEDLYNTAKWFLDRYKEMRANEQTRAFD